MLKLTPQKGFTLIELAMVIGLAAIIIFAVMRTYAPLQQQKKLALVQQQLTTLYQAALKAPSLAAACVVDKPCPDLNLPSDLLTNPWNNSNSVTIVGSQIVLWSTLPNDSVCKTLLGRFTPLQTAADKSASSCTVNKGETSSALKIFISIHQ